MNFFSSLVLLLLAALPLALAANRLTSIIVSYPDNTPDSIISQDKQDLIDAVCCAHLTGIYNDLMISILTSIWC